MTNRLAQEMSPYLQQHANNPVDWYPWSDEAFKRAHDEDKPIHLSVGYAACHWCHVMAHESFENEKVAQFLNKHFINIKVDRQERPDLDDIYQKVVQMMGIGGGWPLTVFMTPNQEPFYGGTYFPPEPRYGRPGFLQLLTTISNLWLNKRHELEKNTQQFLQGYQQLNKTLSVQALPKTNIAYQAALDFAQNTDKDYGGFNGAPKFPSPACYDLILRSYFHQPNPKLFEALEVTLDNMANGGIYDQLGGGFSRYSVDEQWLVPHFEKMLYDNGQLIKLYADAYRLSGNKRWLQVAEETIAYVLRDLMHPEGVFYASEDADSEGVEGKFYTWTPHQILEVLGQEEGQFACQAYGVTSQGNFEDNTNILHRPTKLNATEETHLKQVRDKLFKAREQRIRPYRDENVITSWNALMIQGLCAAYQATANNLYLNAAKKAADFILKHMRMPDGGVYHAWRDNTAKTAGFLDDYAILANALIDLYESSLINDYLEQAVQLTDLIIDKFWDDGLYYTAKDGEQLVHRPRVTQDIPSPSGLSTSVFAFLRLHLITNQENYYQKALFILQQYSEEAAKNPFGFAHLLAALDFMQSSPMTLMLTGSEFDENFQQMTHTIQHIYCPNRVIVRAQDTILGEGKGQDTPAVYVCKNQTCSLPITDLDTLKASLHKT